MLVGSNTATATIYNQYWYYWRNGRARGEIVTHAPRLHTSDWLILFKSLFYSLSQISQNERLTTTTHQKYCHRAHFSLRFSLPLSLSSPPLDLILTLARLKIALAASISLSLSFSSVTRRCRRGVCTTSGNLFSCDWQADSFSCEGPSRAREEEGEGSGAEKGTEKEPREVRNDIPPPPWKAKLAN